MNRRTLPLAALALFAVAMTGAGTTASAQQAQQPEQPQQREQAQQPEQSQQEQQARQLSIEDQHFLMHAVPAGMAEVEMGRLAAEKAQNDQVRQFAERMVTDHSRANEQLMQIAQQKGIQPPQEIGPAHRAAMEHLQQLSGAEFDRAYMGGQVIDHDMAIYMYRRESRHGRDQDIKSFASQTLPTLQEHHDLALKITGDALVAEQR